MNQMQDERKVFNKEMRSDPLMSTTSNERLREFDQTQNDGRKVDENIDDVESPNPQTLAILFPPFLLIPLLHHRFPRRLSLLLLLLLIIIVAASKRPKD